MGFQETNAFDDFVGHVDEAAETERAAEFIVVFFENSYEFFNVSDCIDLLDSFGAFANEFT